MQVMSGADPVASSSGPMRDSGWGAKGKAKQVVDPVPTPEPVSAPEEVPEEDEDDDAAWLRKRQQQAQSKQSELNEDKAVPEPERIVETVVESVEPVKPETTESNVSRPCPPDECTLIPQAEHG